jgi:hypothetical protein
MWLGVWLVCHIQLHKSCPVNISSPLTFSTHKQSAHTHMSLVRCVVGAAIPSSVASQRNRPYGQSFTCEVFLSSKPIPKALCPHPYLPHCIPSIAGFDMDSQHTCARCWRDKAMSIGMLPNVARGQADVSILFLAGVLTSKFTRW